MKAVLRSAFYLFLGWSVLSCSGQLKKTETVSENPSFRDKEGTLVVESKEDPILDDLEKFILFVSEKYPVYFSEDTVSPGLKLNKPFEEYHGFVEKRTKTLSDKRSNYTVFINSYVFENTSDADKVISEHCAEFRDMKLGNSDTDFVMDIIYKIPYFAFRKDNTVYEIYSETNRIGHIISGAIKILRNYHTIDNDDIIPCARNFIPEEFAQKIELSIRKWLKFYGADINYFYRIHNSDGTGESNLMDNPFSGEDTLSIYYRKYEKEFDDIYEPVSYDYSPDRNYYLNVRETSGVYKDAEIGKWYYMGGDDCQEIYLINRKSQQKGLVLWLGASTFAEAAFWAGNKTYVITGTMYNVTKQLFIWHAGDYYVADISGFPKESYFEHNLRERGVFITD